MNLYNRKRRRKAREHLRTLLSAIHAEERRQLDGAIRAMLDMPREYREAAIRRQGVPDAPSEVLL